MEKEAKFKIRVMDFDNAVILKDKAQVRHTWSQFTKQEALAAEDGPIQKGGNQEATAGQDEMAEYSNEGEHDLIAKPSNKKVYEK